MAPPFVSPSPINNAQKSLSQERDRWFESASLQRRVGSELGFREGGSAGFLPEAAWLGALIAHTSLERRVGFSA